MQLLKWPDKVRSDYFLNKHFSGESIHYKGIIGLTIPIFVDQAFLIIMSLLNTAMISSSGVAAVSAVSMVDSLNIFLVNVFIAVATGGTVIVAQYKGQGNHEMVSKTATQAISAVTLLSVFVSVVMIVFHSGTLNVLFGKADVEVFHNATIYLIGSCLSYPFLAIFQAVNGVLRGVGETKPCLGLSLIINLVNTFLNLIFIVFLGMGVTGLVISVIIARIIGMTAALVYLIKYNETIRFRIKDALHIDLSILKKVMFIGIPFAAEQLFFNGGKLLTQTFIVQLGTLAMTAYAIGNTIVMILQVAPNALCIAIVTVVGQCMGRKNIADSRKFIKSFLGLSGVLFIASAILVLPFYPLLAKLFSLPAEIVPTVFILVLMSAITQPLLWPASFLLPGALRAAGDSTFTSVTAMFTMWLIRVVLGYILGITLGFGIIGVWAAMIIEWVVRGGIFHLRFKGKKWYAHNLI
ncbi:MATE family efflux transporter [Bacillus kwashiorkori]|uniref:MATE family efflux transporter n=1 Tax=Bacillus kwashiorkori TaxID=1522318 RepID=UPI0007852BCF|nr:MATE family efflux transporter [Bacillus kwashiorkori]